ncbi:hypothetical protein DFS34DRAFT_590278 [Phlyctochytrium arcticum]|nr:hypothetical protein DFS34DRAFT_590278 [Phlyctochytrium arcticum]
MIGIIRPTSSVISFRITRVLHWKTKTQLQLILFSISDTQKHRTVRFPASEYAAESSSFRGLFAVLRDSFLAIFHTVLQNSSKTKTTAFTRLIKDIPFAQAVGYDPETLLWRDSLHPQQILQAAMEPVQEALRLREIELEDCRTQALPESDRLRNELQALKSSHGQTLKLYHQTVHLLDKATKKQMVAVCNASKLHNALKNKQDQLRLAQRRLNYRKRLNAATNSEESTAAQSAPDTESDQFETFFNNILATKCKDCSGVFDRNTAVVKVRGSGVKVSLKGSCQLPKIFRNFEDARTNVQQSKQGAISCIFNKLVPAAMMHAGLGFNQLMDTAQLTLSKSFENMADKDALALIETEAKQSIMKAIDHVIEQAKETYNFSIAALYNNGWAHMCDAAESHGELIAWDYDKEEYITRPIIAMSLAEKGRGLKAVLREGNFEGPSKKMDHFNLF